MPFRIAVFEQHGSGQLKIDGIREFGRDIIIERVFDLPVNLPPVIDEPEEFVTGDFDGDLVLNFLQHPDLSEYLVRLCNKKGIPVVASGQHLQGAITPFTCCGLGRLEAVGAYGEQFGVPEYDVEVRDGRIVGLKVRRGAPCGATWRVVPRIIGMTPEEALSAIGREVQYLCCANPSAFDPVSGKSPLHFAGDVHIAALKKGINAPHLFCDY
ncbi:MAG: DUF166 family (seleno)protein DfsP [Dissulfurimicrobium sp.]|uniref:DUF166 family (seleno)protein DfsP n=1 Tax=Dissulfurimicrobium sp. TaxID=2022436 RepID=UPI00404A8B52